MALSLHHHYRFHSRICHYPWALQFITVLRTSTERLTFHLQVLVLALLHIWTKTNRITIFTPFIRCKTTIPWKWSISNTNSNWWAQNDSTSFRWSVICNIGKCVRGKCLVGEVHISCMHERLACQFTSSTWKIKFYFSPCIVRIKIRNGYASFLVSKMRTFWWKYCGGYKFVLLQATLVICTWK